MQSSTARRDMPEIILDAAERLLARYGYRKVTMEDLAREAGIGKRTIYLHFAGKVEVALRSIDRVVERLLDQLRLLAHAEGSPEERLRRMLITRVLFRFDSVREYYRSFDEMFAALRPAYMARREQYFATEAQVFAEVLCEGQSLQLFTFEDAVIAARTLLLATNALLPYSLSPRELGAREDVEEKITRITDLLLNGLRRRETAAPVRKA
jgi:AcrR family transcriptional regulator